MVNDGRECWRAQVEKSPERQQQAAPASASGGEPVKDRESAGEPQPQPSRVRCELLLEDSVWMA